MLAPVERNPHADFGAVQASRPDWDQSHNFRYTKTAAPDWSNGNGSNELAGRVQKQPTHVAIDPYAEGRPGTLNYKFLISSVVPRPIALISTCSKDGASENLAPFSYFSVINHDPPLFTVGFVGSIARAKDTLRNLVETGECVINIVSESFIEAANATGINAPYGVSEWEISGLTPVRDCHSVRPPRVGESVVSIEAKLNTVTEFNSRVNTGKTTGTLVVRFWAREYSLNSDASLVDPSVLRPMSRLGGITYGRVTEAIEVVRPTMDSKS